MKESANILFYTTPTKKIQIDVRLRDETLWLSQKQMAELFGVNVPAISKHLKNIYESGELHHEATISKMETVRKEGGREVARQVDFYNLDAIIVVDYFVNSMQATQFRMSQDCDYRSDFDRMIEEKLKGKG